MGRTYWIGGQCSGWADDVRSYLTYGAWGVQNREFQTRSREGVWTWDALPWPCGVFSEI